MKRRRLIIFLVFAVTTLFLLWHFTDQTIVPANQPAARQKSNKDKQESVKTTMSSAVDRKITPVRHRSTVPDAVHEYVQKSTADPQYDWKQPINFYGKVVDENNQMVAGAKVDFGWNDLSDQGRSTASTMSDSHGLFFLLNRTGKRLFVDVNKEGYYSSRQNPLAFEYANPADGLFTPDPNNPVIFHLRKKGEAEPLIAIKRNLRVPRDGTPIALDLFTGKQVPAGQGQMEIRCLTSDQKDERNRYDWQCSISIPGGGFLETTEEFPFTAPEDAYQPTIEFNFPKTKEDWRPTVAGQYFFKLPNGNYGRLHFEMISYGDHFCMIQSFLNPNGSRNLEYDPNVQSQ